MSVHQHLYMSVDDIFEKKYKDFISKYKLGPNGYPLEAKEDLDDLRELGNDPEGEDLLNLKNRRKLSFLEIANKDGRD
jgi:hypothetical protein